MYRNNQRKSGTFLHSHAIQGNTVGDHSMKHKPTAKEAQRAELSLSSCTTTFFLGGGGGKEIFVTV